MLWVISKFMINIVRTDINLETHTNMNAGCVVLITYTGISAIVKENMISSTS